MTHSLILEDFSAPIAAAPTPREPAPVHDPMQGYETGYKAGWDDAMAEATKSQNHINAEFGRNLQELSFSFEEAKLQVCASVQELVATLCTSLMPRYAAHGLANHILNVMEPILDQVGAPDIMLVCAPQDHELLSKMVTDAPYLPLTLRTEDSLMEGQVHFRFGAEQHEIEIAQFFQQVDALMLQHFADLFPAKSAATDPSAPFNDFAMSQEIQDAG